MYSDRGPYDQRYSPNVRHYVSSVCSITVLYEQHCYVAGYQFQDIASLFQANIPWQKMQLHKLPNHNYWQLNKLKTTAKIPSILKLSLIALMWLLK